MHHAKWLGQLVLRYTSRVAAYLSRIRSEMNCWLIGNVDFVVRSNNHRFRYEVSIKRQLSNGSYTKASKTAIKLSLLRCNTDMTLSHVRRYVPSIPVTSIAFINIRVNRNGIFSGNFSRSIATYNRTVNNVCKYYTMIEIILRSSPRNRCEEFSRSVCPA